MAQIEQADHDLKWGLRMAVFTAVGYFIAAICSLWVARGADGIATFWPAGGVLFAAAMLARGQQFGACLVAGVVASVAANLLTGTPTSSTIIFAAAAVLEAVIARLLLRLGHLRGREFTSLDGLMRFVLAALAATLLSASLVTALLGEEQRFWLTWFLTDALGVLVLTPIIVTLSRHLTAVQVTLGKTAQLRFAVAQVVVGAISAVALGQPTYPLQILPVFAVLVTSFAFGLLGATVGVLVIAMVMSGLASFGFELHLVASRGILQQSLAAQIYLAVLCSAALSTAAVLAARDRLTRQLAEKMRLLELAESVADIGHWRLDPASGTVTWSAGVFRVHGVPIGEAPPLSEAIESYHPDDREMVTAEIERAIKLRRKFAFRGRLLRAGGEVRHVLVKGEPDWTLFGDAFGLVGVIKDVTRQVEYEAQLETARLSAEKAAQDALIVSRTDQLTGLANRRYLGEMMEEALQSCSERQPLSLAIFDIDHFKRVNDTFGHDVGDIIIKDVARIASESVGEAGCVGRFGGEEFVVVLPGVPGMRVHAVLERVRSSIEHASLVPKVTISIGASEWRAGDSVDHLLKRADKNLYKAKQEGRNRCCGAEVSVADASVDKCVSAT
jgi:diguanylate cyclase (GGDEF)-like protein